MCIVTMYGSEAPGGYSTVIIKPSLPGYWKGLSIKSPSHPGANHARHKISFAILINLLNVLSVCCLGTEAEFGRLGCRL